MFFGDVMREFALLQRIFAANARLPASVLVPPGDDMAEIRLEDGTNDDATILIAADSAIEGRHTPLGCDPYLIGKKAVLRNVSDVAAMMNARPLATVACVTVPSATSEERVWRLCEGLRETAERWNAPLIGGDLATFARSSECDTIIASVTILATRVDRTRPVATRRDARVGDGVYVTGAIGGAWDRATGLGRHLDFTPRVQVAGDIAAVLRERLGAAIDLSDGLGRDLGHIARMSRVAIMLDLEAIPLHASVVGVRDPLEAIADGEDYELAFTARGDVPTHVAGVPITRIGTVYAVGSAETSVREAHAIGAVTVEVHGRMIDVSHAGHEHHSGPQESGEAP